MLCPSPSFCFGIWLVLRTIVSSYKGVVIWYFFMYNGKSGHVNKFNFSLCIASSAVCVLQTFRHLIQNSQQHQKPQFSQSTFHQNNEIYSARAINIFILPKLFTYSDICDIWWNLELFYPVVKLGGQIIEFCIYTNLLIAPNWNVTYIFSFREIVN